MSHRRRIALKAAGLLSTAGLLSATPVVRAGDQDVIRLLETRRCPRCSLADADLVHADLRDADLRGSRLQRANLSQASLDGARLNGADLSFTSLLGASLRGVDLRGARLDGTDLRQADLSGARLEVGALSRAHWQQAKGVSADLLSYPDLHNAGVEAARAGRFPDAERWFGDAIRRQPDAAISWVARGISRSELGQMERAAADLSYAASLYRLRGEEQEARQLEQVAGQLTEPAARAKPGHGLGSTLLGGAMAAFGVLAPLALRALVPVGL
ncbi:MAG: pentapeptide repeat-containing protein [Cyanobacteriota bacterium]|nr:pentapeptide repeat-containing protein [Cyanobacteriota bacterium]